jgi:predicted ArsR family transcriptional regulator
LLDIDEDSMSNARAAEMTVQTLRALGRLDAVDEAAVQAVLSLAEAVDTEPHNAAMWREYQSALRALREIGPDDGDHDEIAELIEAIRGTAQVVDEAKPEPRNSRR